MSMPGFRRGLATGLLVAVMTAPGCATAEQAKAPVQLNLKAGLNAMQADDYDAAVIQLERAIVADPKNPDGYTALGQSHRQLGDSEKALKYSRIALEIEPSHLSALQLQGRAQLDVGELEAAETTLERLGRRCDRICAEYELLSRAVGDFKARQTN